MLDVRLQFLKSSSHHPPAQPLPAASLQQPASLPGQQDPKLQSSNRARVCALMPLAPLASPQPAASLPGQQGPMLQSSNRARVCALIPLAPLASQQPAASLPGQQDPMLQSSNRAGVCVLIPSPGSQHRWARNIAGLAGLPGPQYCLDCKVARIAILLGL